MSSQELDLLGDDAKVYKLIGPVLLKQDVNEAKANVNKRLEFINNELCVCAHASIGLSLRSHLTHLCVVMCH